MNRHPITFLLGTPFLPLLPAAVAFGQPAVHQATGLRISQVSETSATVWVRLTDAPNSPQHGPEPADPPPADPSSLPHATPGAPGRARLRFISAAALIAGQPPIETPWVDLHQDSDFSHVFHLTGLLPATLYWLNAETTGPGGAPVHGALRGRFATAPPANQPARVLLTVASGYETLAAESPRGFDIDVAINNMEPAFHLIAGGAVRLGSETPNPITPERVRSHWHRLFSFPRWIELTRYVPLYFLANQQDPTAPGMTPDQLQTIDRQQLPIVDPPPQTIRWGQDLEVWLADQPPRHLHQFPPASSDSLESLKRTLMASDATFKLIVRPEPVLGADLPTNPSPPDPLRAWLIANCPKNVYLATGGLGYQSHILDPVTGLHEFRTGPATDSLANNLPTGFHPPFLRRGGGYLSILIERSEASPPTIRFRLHDPSGKTLHDHQDSPH